MARNAARTDDRPSPEDLIERYRLREGDGEPGRGRLRVLLGAAPGVGKTYAMLRDGHRLRDEGHDVVVGLLETHGRPETAAQAGDLEVVPRRVVSYRGVAVEEMDTDAILARRPEIVLIDELAHTNAPGSPRDRRWEDVEAIRDAGIDVITTLNVQHLEGLRDVVFGVTGVTVRETVPDAVLDDADVQLIDLPSEALIERLEQGKVYPPERARQALANFFKPASLTALRELALRQTAAGVDERLEEYLRGHAPDEPWQVTERVLVLVDGEPDAGTIIRNAWRLASGLRGTLTAVAVLPPGGTDALPEPGRTRLLSALGLADDLGAEVRRVESDRVADALVGVARETRATILVLPHQPPGGWLARRAALVDALFNRLDGVDIHLVARRLGG